MRFMRISSVQIFSNRKQRLDEPLHPQLGEVLLSLKWMLAPLLGLPHSSLRTQRSQRPLRQIFLFGFQFSNFHFLFPPDLPRLIPL